MRGRSQKKNLGLKKSWSVLCYCLSPSDFLTYPNLLIQFKRAVGAWKISIHTAKAV